MPAERAPEGDFDINPDELPPGTFYIPEMPEKPGRNEVPYIGPEVIRWDEERKRRKRDQPEIPYEPNPAPEYGPENGYRKEDDQEHPYRGVDIIEYSR